jgi:hypothetical protein
MPSRPAARPRRHRPPAAAAFLLAAALFLGSAAAQTRSLGVLAGDHGTSLLLRVTGLQEGDLQVDAWARGGPGLAFGALWRGSSTFGPAGNVVIEGGGDVVLAPGAPALRGWAGARGVIGPLAASLRLDAGSDDGDEFEPLARSDAGRRALGLSRGAWDAGARLSVTYRLDRDTILSAEPRVRVGGGAWMTSASLAVRRAGVADELDLWLGAEGGVRAGQSSLALALGTVWVRRREPDSWLRLWLGYDGLHWLPGVEALVAGRAPGASWSLSAGYVPHRLDARPWRVAFETAVTMPAGAGTWRMRTAASGGAPLGATGATGTAFVIGLAHERPWSTAGPGAP